MFVSGRVGGRWVSLARRGIGGLLLRSGGRLRSGLLHGLRWRIEMLRRCHLRDLWRETLCCIAGLKLVVEYGS